MKRFVRPALAGAGVLAVAVAGGQPAPVHASARCSVSRVRYVPYPGHSRQLDRTPWIGGRPGRSGLAALLWYWPRRWTRAHERRALIASGGTMREGWSTKVMWVFAGTAQRDRGGSMLTIRGRRLDGAGRFSQREAEIGYDGQDGAPSYASIIDLPTPGCWRIDVTTAHLHGHVVFEAVLDRTP